MSLFFIMTTKTKTFISPEGREWLIGLLKTGPAKITFTKTDGTERIMKCTLQESVIPQYEKKTDRTKTVSEEVLAVYDLEKSAWRSCRLDSILHVTFHV